MNPPRFPKGKKPKRGKISTKFRNIWSKLGVNPAPSTSPPPPKKAVRISKKILFEGLGNSVAFSIRKTETCPEPLHTDKIVHYLKWVQKSARLPASCFVVAFGYLYRLDRSQKETAGDPTVFTRSNWKLLMTTAIMIAQKFSADESYSNYEIAKLLRAEYTLNQLNEMEVEILTKLNWDCFFTPQEYQDYYRCIRWYAILS